MYILYTCLYVLYMMEYEARRVNSIIVATALSLSLSIYIYIYIYIYICICGDPMRSDVHLVYMFICFIYMYMW